MKNLEINLSNSSNPDSVGLTILDNEVFNMCGINSQSNNVIGPVFTTTSYTSNGINPMDKADIITGDVDRITYIGSNVKQDIPNKIYIVDPWQSKNPIKINDGLYVSLVEDMIDLKALKRMVFDKLSETNPDFIVKCGMNIDNLILCQKVVSLEVN